MKVASKIVRAKFKCVSVTTTLDGKRFVHSYKFQVVMSGSPENDEFFRYTPAGWLELSSVKDDLFEIGKEYYLDFLPAPKEENGTEEKKYHSIGPSG